MAARPLWRVRSVWLPIGAEQMAGGYEVAWTNHRRRSVHGLEYRQQRQLVSYAIGAVSGTSTTLESLETSFHQDLNGDGVIGVPAAYRR